MTFALRIGVIGLLLVLIQPVPCAANAVNTIKLSLPAKPGESVERITLPLNKAVIVQLPTSVSDVLVSNPEIADAVVRTRRRIYLLGRKVGQANVFFFGSGDRQIGAIDLMVERDIADLDRMLRKLVPRARLGIESLNDNIMLTGTAPNAVEADRARDIAARFVGNPENVLNLIRIQGNEQVLLRVRIVELQRTVLKQMGVDLDVALQSGSLLIDGATQNPFSLVGRSLGGLTDGISQANVLGNTRVNLPGSDFIDGTIRAFERDGLARTLAEPNLTAISGEAAKFLAGGEYPVPTSRDRNGNVTVEFKPFGVGLGFTPVVLDAGRISLRISTEVSELTTEGSFQLEQQSIVADGTDVTTIPGVTVPALNVRRAETTVELPSGGSLVMAGLIRQETKQNIDGVPGLKNLPILGSLFRSRDFQNNETELVVIVTPYLVDPVAEKRLATPVDGFAPADELRTFLIGRINEVYGQGEAVARLTDLTGRIGFTLE